VPRQKNFKRLVRGRMAKTGESYTTARSQFEPPAAAGAGVGGDPDAAPLARALAAAGFVNPLTGLPFTEQLLFGAAGGIGFAYLVFVYPGWTSVNLDCRFNALYFEKEGLIETACGRLGLPLRVRRISDRDVADRQLRQALTVSAEVALTVDLVRMPGAATGPAPLSPRTVTVCGSDAGLTVVGLPRGRVAMGWDELIDARWTNAKKYGGLYLFGPPAEVHDIQSALVRAIGRTADCLLGPGRGTRFDGTFGVPGIRRWARLLTDPRDRKGWPQLCPEPDSLRDALDSVVRGLGGPGASGNASRRLYAAFLDEAAALVGRPELATVADAYRDLGDRWAELIGLAARLGATGTDLAAPLLELADAEQAAALSLRATATEPTEGGAPR
jgi:hypothetical protein